MKLKPRAVLIAITLAVMFLFAAAPAMALGSFQEMVSRGKIAAADFTSQNLNSSTSDLEAIDILKEHGINTLVISTDNHRLAQLDFSDGVKYPDHLPQAIVDYSEKAYEKNMLNFVSVWFTNYFERWYQGSSKFQLPCDADYDGDDAYYGDYVSAVAEHRAVFSNGIEGCMVSPWDEKYWRHLTDVAVALAKLDQTERHRVDGVLFDFELYLIGNFKYSDSFTQPHYLTEEFGFEDFIFNKYLSAGRCSQGQAPKPTGPSFEERARRVVWLSENGCLDDYYSFLADDIKGLATNLKTEVKKVNRDFLIGFYPSPKQNPPEGDEQYRNKYYDNILAGFSDSENPAVLFGTEGWIEGSRYFQEVNFVNRKVSGKNYYNLTGLKMPALHGGSYNDEIYAYYVGRTHIWYWEPAGWDGVLIALAKNTNGYEMGPSKGLTDDYEFLTNPPSFTRILCGSDPTRTTPYPRGQYERRECNSKEEYNAQREAYLDAMMNVKHELFCGDRICDEQIVENCSNCPEDCGACHVPECGDGIIQGNEECDSTNVPTTCTALGFAGGTLGCTAQCTLDKSGCTQTQECVDTPTLINEYIPQWKRGERTMLALMQKMKLWNRAGCPP